MTIFSSLERQASRLHSYSVFLFFLVFSAATLSAGALSPFLVFTPFVLVVLSIFRNTLYTRGLPLGQSILAIGFLIFPLMPYTLQVPVFFITLMSSGLVHWFMTRPLCYIRITTPVIENILQQTFHQALRIHPGHPMYIVYMVWDIERADKECQLTVDIGQTLTFPLLDHRLTRLKPWFLFDSSLFKDNILKDDSLSTYILVRRTYTPSAHEQLEILGQHDT